MSLLDWSVMRSPGGLNLIVPCQQISFGAAQEYFQAPSVGTSVKVVHSLRSRLILSGVTERRHETPR